MKKCSYCGRYYAGDESVCSLDLTPLVQVEPVPASRTDPAPVSGPPPDDGPALFKAGVKFEGPGQGTKSKALNQGFQGRGSMEAYRNRVVFAGRQRRMFSFGRRATAGLKFADIFNVERSGKQVRFLFLPEGSGASSSTFCFRAETEDEAGRIAALLPQTQTPDFAQAQAENRDFQAKLQAATPRAFVTSAIIVINLLVFLLMTIAGAGLVSLEEGESIKFVSLDPEVHVKWGANFGPLTSDGQWWRLLTSTFLHFGILHVLLNLWALYAAGQLVERLYGNGFFLLLYLTAGVSGSVASVLWNPEVLSAGASGALFGVYGALLVYLVLQRNSVPRSVTAQLRNSFLVCVGYSLFYGFSHAGIDNAAHLGGLAGGAVMGMALARPLGLEERKKTTSARWLAGGCVAVLLPTLMWLRVPNSGGPYRQQEQFRSDVRWFAEEEKRILSDWEEARKKIQAGLTDAAAAEILQPLVVRWEQAHEHLANARLEETTWPGRFQQQLLKYIGLRRDATMALVHGLKTGDRASLEKFKALESMAQRVIEEANAESQSQ